MDTQNKAWAEDRTKFGYRMLAKMGWTEGKGLGVKEDGVTSHLRVKRKRCAGGIGTDGRVAAQWRVTGAVASGFNDVLARIAVPPEAPEADAQRAPPPPPPAPTDAPVAPAAAAAGQSYFARRARQKNVRQYSAAQLREIFGGAQPAPPPLPAPPASAPAGVAAGRVGKHVKKEKRTKEEKRARKERKAKRRAEKEARRASRALEEAAEGGSD